MKVRPHVILLLVTAAIAGAGFTVFKTSGAHPGSTGAPGDLTCAQSGCHTDAKVTADDGTVNTLLFSTPDSTYKPGETYTLTLQVQLPSIQKFGFELLALKDSTNSNVGTLGALETSRTQLINHFGPSNDLRYSMTHKTAGTMTSTSGAIQWKMKWTAPPADAGTITFWYATNCTNNNGFATGDKLFLSHFTIHPEATVDTSTTGIASLRHDGLQVRAFRDGGAQYVEIGSGPVSGAARVSIYDISGRLLLEKNTELMAGEKRTIRLPEGCCAGTCLLKLCTDGAEFRKKIILE
jgi:hypothetical protein